MLDVQDASRLFGGKRAVDGVSFTLHAPGFIGIIGRSGAGKSTFLRLMNRQSTLATMFNLWSRDDMRF